MTAVSDTSHSHSTQVLEDPSQIESRLSPDSVLPRKNLRAYVPSQNFEVREPADGEANDGSVEFEGYAIKWEEEAQIGGFFFSFREKFKKGSFKKTIAERGPQGNGQIKFKARHPWAESNAGKFLELKEDATGLFFRARTIATDAGRNMAVELREGVVDTLSVGFDALQELFDKEENLRTIIEARLFEISGVDWPAYEGAKVTATRSIEELPDFMEALEQEIREGKVLSKSNKVRLVEARDRIQQVIDSAGGDDKPEPEDEPLDGGTRENPDQESTESTEEHSSDATLELEFALRERELDLT